MTFVDTAFLLMGLLLFAALVTLRAKTPAPVVFAALGVVVGLCWHFLPTLPTVRMPPNIVLLIFLPPLLFTAAYSLPLASVIRNVWPIMMLAVGLVLVTMLLGASIGHFLAGLPWAAAFILGAIIAPPDPVAATAVADQTGLPHRLIVILEGEGLINDAVAIVAYTVALQAAVTGVFRWDWAVLDFIRESAVGITLGVAVGWAAMQLRMRVNNVPLTVGVSFMTPYLVYHLADRAGGSGVLAVVMLGFVLRYYAPRVPSAAARLAARTAWSAYRYVTTASLFFLLGLLLGEISIGWPGWPIFWSGLALAIAVILLRICWMLILPRLAISIHSGHPPSTWQEQTVLGWAGMRGVVSLALTLALPLTLNKGDVRTTIIFMTFVVIFVTLLLQGATLLPLVRHLGVGDPTRSQRDESDARERAGKAGEISIREHWKKGDISDRGERLAFTLASGRIGIAKAGTPDELEDKTLLLEALNAQRREIKRLRDADKLGESVVERLETEIDIDEMVVFGEGNRLTGADEN